MVSLGYLGNIFKNMVTSENILAVTLFLTIIYRGT
jgi:hypothetical protein